MKKSNEQHKDTLSKRVSRNSEQASKGSGPKTENRGGRKIKTAAEIREKMKEKYGIKTPKNEIKSNLKKKK